jgi:photosystem II stability/assembly factor-like uncharacterized protein
MTASQRPGWQQSTLNGGGFITGILQDSVLPTRLFARSDVGGVFRSDDGGKSWQPCNNGMSRYHQHDVRSIAISPHDHQVLFRASGSRRGSDFFGTIHKSTDGGDSWSGVTDCVDFYGNGETRQYGEVVRISPHNRALVAAGGYSKGLWLSEDMGANWHCAGLQHERIACVQFDPHEADVIYIGTISNFDRDPVFVAQQYDYVRPHASRLYRYRRAAGTWDVLLEGVDIADIAVNEQQAGVIHLACLQDGVRSTYDGGQTWINSAGRLSAYPIGALTIDPRDPNRLYAAAETFPNFDDTVPPIGIYVSSDGGQRWALLHWHTEADILNYPSYMSLPYAGWAVSKVLADATDSQTLYMSNWYGVAISRDGGQTWDANFFRGLENVCVENMVAHPAEAGTLYIVMPDHVPKFSTDGGQTYHAMPRPDFAIPRHDSTALAASCHLPGLVLYGMKGSGGCSIVQAEADGSRARVVLENNADPDTERSRLALQSRAAGVSVQALAEDPHIPGTFYAFLDGVLAAGAGLYRSQDWGNHWQRLPLPLPDHVRRIPHERHWIENELLSVVIAQTKNVCGTNQLLRADPHEPGVLYLGEWTEGLFRSGDGGQTWQNISGGLPFRYGRAAVLNCVYLHPQVAGTVYAGFIQEGLWRSQDSGQTWAKVFPAGHEAMNATSIAISDDGMLLAVACEPLYWSPCSAGVWISRDAGRTWHDIYDKRLGALRWKTLIFEPRTRRLHGGTCGGGVLRFALDEL